MKKIARKIHLWLSVPFGLIVTLVCFSGAMLVFEDEVNELSRPELYFVEAAADATPLPIEQLMEKVSATLPDSVQATGITIPSEKGRSWQVSLSKPRRASVYVNPYTGEVLGKGGRMAFFTVMFRMHRWLLDSTRPESGIWWGKMIVGVSTLAFVFVLISGIIIWWPRTVKALKNSLKITARRGLRRFWHDLHVAGGMYALVILLALGLTGLTWSFGWYRSAFYGVFGVSVSQQGGGPGGAPQQGGQPNAAPQMDGTQAGAPQGERGARPEQGGQPSERSGRPAQDLQPGAPQEGAQPGERSGRPERKHSPYANWQKVYDELSAANPEAERITVSRGSANVAMGGFGNQRASDRYRFNPRNGEITETTLYRDADRAGKVRGWIYSVHVGNWGGMLTRILTFLAALLGASLPLTGYYLWIKRVWGKKR